MHHPRARRPIEPRRREHERRSVLAVAALTTLGLMVVAGARFGAADPSDEPQMAAGLQLASGAGVATSTTATATAAADGLPDLDGDLPDDPGCAIKVRALEAGDSGKHVRCLQEALAGAGAYQAPITGTFDKPTVAAVRALQRAQDLVVDGIVGRQTAMTLNIWPGDDALVVRTPEPEPGAVDLLGYPLSSVATSGPDAPPLPRSSGSGRRLVYDRLGQRVWAVDDEDEVIRSWLVTGSMYGNELPGTHEVYSRSEMSTAWNGQAYLPKMVRYLKTTRGHIGFHAIPLHIDDGSPYQTEAELGQRLSGGCQRQANADAAFVWDFAQVGTTVVVL